MNQYYLTSDTAKKYIKKNLIRRTLILLGVTIAITFTIMDDFGAQNLSLPLKLGIVLLLVVVGVHDTIKYGWNIPLKKLSNSYYQIQGSKLLHVFSDGSTESLLFENIMSLKSTRKGLKITSTNRKHFIPKQVNQFEQLTTEIKKAYEHYRPKKKAH